MIYRNNMSLLIQPHTKSRKKCFQLFKISICICLCVLCMFIFVPCKISIVQGPVQSKLKNYKKLCKSYLPVSSGQLIVLNCFIFSDLQSFCMQISFRLSKILMICNYCRYYFCYCYFFKMNFSYQMKSLNLPSLLSSKKSDIS